MDGADDDDNGVCRWKKLLLNLVRRQELIHDAQSKLFVFELELRSTTGYFRRRCRAHRIFSLSAHFDLCFDQKFGAQRFWRS